MFNDHYAYLFAIIIIFPFWLLLFMWRRDCWQQMFILGILNGMLTIPQEMIFLRYYWHPEYISYFYWHGLQIGGLEDFFYGFFTAGIASVIYEEVFGKIHAKRKDRRHHWSWFMIPFIVVANLVFISPLHSLINPIYVCLLSCIIVTICMAYFRRDLIADILISGFLFGVINLVGFLLFISLFPDIIGKWWMLGNLSGIFIFGIPIEEILFGFAIGMVIGPVYEFLMGLKFKNA